MPEMNRSLWLAALLAVTACGGPDGTERDPDGALGSSGVEGGRETRGDSPAIAPNDTGASVLPVPDAGSAPDPHPWVNGTARGGSSPAGAATLLTVRTARQDGFDRIVFEFDSHVPQWSMEYVDRPQYECGSGEAVRLEGDGWLQVNFEAANAHTEEGRATNAPRHVADPAGANLREMRRICDFEAQVQYVIGVASPNRFRAFQLSSPARLVVDIQH